jgi:hypothetical protein
MLTHYSTRVTIKHAGWPSTRVTIKHAGVDCHLARLVVTSTTTHHTTLRTGATREREMFANLPPHASKGARSQDRCCRTALAPHRGHLRAPAITRLRLQKCSVLTVKVAKELAWHASHRGEQARGMTTRTSPKDDSEACRLKTRPKHVRKMMLGQPQELAILQANTKPSKATCLKPSILSLMCSLFSLELLSYATSLSL